MKRRSNPRRKVTPRVIDGKAQRKNNSDLTPNYWNTDQKMPRIDRERPGPGYRHVLRKRDIERFIRLLPDWDELSKGLNAILLARGEVGCAGWHSSHGVVAICAWDREMWQYYRLDFYRDHKDVLDRLGVETSDDIDDDGNKCILCRFTEQAVRGYQLLHILLHELGHHNDRMTTRTKRCPARGESYAEQYALKYEKQIWDAYLREFDLY